MSTKKQQRAKAASDRAFKRIVRQETAARLAAVVDEIVEPKPLGSRRLVYWSSWVVLAVLIGGSVWAIIAGTM